RRGEPGAAGAGRGGCAAAYGVCAGSWCLRVQERVQSASFATYVAKLEVSAGAEQLPGLGGGHRGALGEATEFDGALDELGVVLDRDPLGEGEDILHADAQVPALAESGERDGQGGAADPGRRPAGDLGREGGDRGDERVGGAGHPTGDAHDQVDVDLAAVREPVAVEQPAQGGDLAEVEELELRHDLALLGALVEVADE